MSFQSEIKRTGGLYDEIFRIVKATVDCYNEAEELTGLFTLFDENLRVPFDTMVPGVPVTVEAVIRPMQHM